MPHDPDREVELLDCRTVVGDVEPVVVDAVAVLPYLHGVVDANPEGD